MIHRTWSMMGVVTLCALGLLTSSAFAQNAPLSKSLLNVTVAFGAGLNTQGTENHKVVPDNFRVKRDGVVHFMVAGFHQIAVYDRGTKPGDITDSNADDTFINDSKKQIFLGQSPTTPEDGFSNDRNRVESVYFERPGIYLVICNVRDHFEEGMFALVDVRK